MRQDTICKPDLLECGKDLHTRQRRKGAIIYAAILLIAPLSFAQAVEPFSSVARPSEVTAILGAQSVVIPSGRGGLEHFPDMPISILSQRPFTFLMVSGNDTYLWSGQTLAASMPVANVLPPGPMGSPDNNYAGISSVFHDQKRQKLVAFYHAEDKEGIGKLENGVQGFYGRICVAESSMDKLEFKKLGPAITADQPKKPRGWETEGGPKQAWLAQGVGDPSVCNDAENKYLLCVYNELSNRLKAGRGVQLCLARALLDSNGMPGSWKKYYQGAYSEPGLAGHDTPVITAYPHGDTVSPHLQYVPEWKRYVVVFGVGIFAEINGQLPKAVDSGFYLSTSQDATTWTKPVKLQTVFNVWVNGKASAMHPFLVIHKATADSLTGQLMSSYTPNWPDVPRYLAASPIRLRFTNSSSVFSDTKLTADRPDRAVVEWVITSGGSVEVMVNGKAQVIGKKESLPSESFRVRRVDLRNSQKVVDEDLLQLGSLSEMTELNLMTTSITDAGLRHLRGLKKLTDLNVAGTSVNGSGFKYLKVLDNLKVLLCGGCPITDSNLADLKSLQNLSVLGLIDTKVTDVGMEHLRELRTLKELRLTGTQVADKGMLKLTSIKGLEKLSVVRTKVTPMGVKAFTKALPDCEVQLQ